MRCEWLTSGSHEWASALQLFEYDAYHLPAYTELYAKRESGTAAAFLCSDDSGDFLVPLIQRAIEPEGHDFTSAYGYPGPLFSARSSDTFAERAVGSFVDALRAEGAVSAFIRMHPLLDSHSEQLQLHGEMVLGGETVYVDLSHDHERMWRDTRENHRRSIRKAESLGLNVYVDDEWQYLDEFITAYDETMQRVEAKQQYFFPREYYLDLKHALGERLHLLVVTTQQNEIAAGALFTECNGIVQYHLGGTRNQHLQIAPIKLLFHFARQWFSERSARFMHLGGGVGASQDPLFHFKAGFSKERAHFYTWRIVAEPSTYRNLSEAWSKRTGRDPSISFFPSYREPL